MTTWKCCWVQMVLFILFLKKNNQGKLMFRLRAGGLDFEKEKLLPYLYRKCHNAVFYAPKGRLKLHLPCGNVSAEKCVITATVWAVCTYNNAKLSYFLNFTYIIITASLHTSNFQIIRMFSIEFKTPYSECSLDFTTSQWIVICKKSNMTASFRCWSTLLMRKIRG